MELGNDKLLEMYLHWCKNEKRFSLDTITTYWHALSPFLKYLAERKIQLTEVDKDIARDYLVFLHGQNIKPVSQNDYRSALQTFYNYIVKQKIKASNPFVGLPKQKEGKPKKDILSVDALVKLIDNVNDIGTFLFRDTIMFELFWNSGLRTSELSALQKHQLEYNTVFIEKEQRMVVCCDIKIVGGKGGKDRFVTVGETTTMLIKKYLVGRDLRFPVSEYLFPNNHGRQLNRRQVYGIIKGFLDLTSSKKKGAHVLRHTYATMLLQNGVNILAVQKMLGHSNAKTTTIYATPSIEMLQNEYNKAHPDGNKAAIETTKNVIPTIDRYIVEKSRIREK